MVIKEEEVDIIKRNDREVIITGHIMSDNFKSIHFKRCIIASEFIMDKDICVTFIHLQNSFTRELIIQLKIILEKITQVDFDITLIIENCKRILYTYIIDIIDLINITEKEHINHLEKESYISLDEYIRKHIPNISQYSKTSCSQGPPSSFIDELIISKGFRGSHLRAYNLKKAIIKPDIVFDILDIIGHFAQRGHQSPTTIKLDSITEYHLLDSSSISGPNRFSVPSAINMDIIVNVEKFIRITLLWYIHHINILNMNDIIRSEPSAEYHLLDYICINGLNHISVIRVSNLDINTKADRFIRTIRPSRINLFINQDMVIMTGSVHRHLQS